MSFEGERVLVTGGASFIGSHLVEDLVSRGANVRVADDFSSGTDENLAAVHDEIEVASMRL
jgi:UDP-glucose 4-epimerase